MAEDMVDKKFEETVNFILKFFWNLLKALFYLVRLIFNTIVQTIGALVSKFSS